MKALLEDIVTATLGAAARPTRNGCVRRAGTLMLALAIAGAAATPVRAAAGATTVGRPAAATTVGRPAAATTVGRPGAATTAGQPPPDAATSATVIATAVKAQAASCVAPALAPGAHGDAVTYLQLLLNNGGFWGEVNASYGEVTTQAVMALQAAHGLPVDGVMGSATWLALCSSGRPVPRSRSGLVLEVDKRRQLLLVAQDGQTVWALHTSTGGNYWYDHGRSFARTPEGRFSVYVRVDGWQHEPLGALYRPAFVVGGVAVHGGYAVPPYPASHGCIRQTNQAMDMLWAAGYLNVGTNVWIYS